MKGKKPAHHRESDLAEKYNTPGQCTTVMIRNIPAEYTQDELIKEVIDTMGAVDLFDFFYLPWDGQSNQNNGYAFVNFHETSTSQKAVKLFNNYRFKLYESQKVGKVSAAHVQGLENNLRHLQDRAVVHGNHPCAPVVIWKGQKVALSKIFEEFKQHDAAVRAQKQHAPHSAPGRSTQLQWDARSFDGTELLPIRACSQGALGMRPAQQAFGPAGLPPGFQMAPPRTGSHCSGAPEYTREMPDGSLMNIGGLFMDDHINATMQVAHRAVAPWSAPSALDNNLQQVLGRLGPSPPSSFTGPPRLPMAQSPLSNGMRQSPPSAGGSRAPPGLPDPYAVPVPDLTPAGVAPSSAGLPVAAVSGFAPQSADAPARVEDELLRWPSQTAPSVPQPCKFQPQPMQPLQPLQPMQPLQPLQPMQPMQAMPQPAYGTQVGAPQVAAAGIVKEISVRNADDDVLMKFLNKFN